MWTIIGKYALKILGSKWFWYAALIAVIIFLFFSLKGMIGERDRWKSNYDASTTFNSYASKQVVLKTGEFKKREKGWMDKLKKYKIPVRKVQYVHTIEWKTSGTDTVVVHDTIIKYGDKMIPAEYASKQDSCLFMEYIKPKGDSIGVLNHTYNGSIDIICHWVRPKPKFWNWLAGKKDLVVTVKSPCFADTNVTFNKKIELIK